SDRLLVMYAGQVVEFGPTRTVFDTPSHPYGSSLLEAFPSIRGPKVPLTGIPGDPPNLANPPAGCRFHPRCPQVRERCLTEAPELYDVTGTDVVSRCLVHHPTDPLGVAIPAATGAEDAAANAPVPGQSPDVELEVRS
ncbi:MAG TPA: oligopeptide/dipeptide ABC transporter ATP-binding protein, partial [Actinospica sp.]|nr:oligopeptide/dipeptide ABC transporter ATP-binding protein [Actinospica sp.]